MAFLVKSRNKRVRMIAHAAEELVALLVGDARKYRRIRNLIAVEVQDRQNNAVGERVHELIGLPRGGKRACLCLAIADDSNCEQGRIGKHSSISMGKRIAELASLMDRTRGFRCKVARYTTWIRKAAEELLQPHLVVCNKRIPFAVRSIENRLRRASRSTMARAHQKNGILSVVMNKTVHMTH